jgi:hypothetical protein
MNKNGEVILASSLASVRSIQISLESIRLGEAGLTKRRENLLNRVPNEGDYASFKKDSITIEDLAYLSAQEGHEFALLRSKSNDILLHGNGTGCTFTDDLEVLLVQGRMELVAHSHPDVDHIIPSSEDRDFLKSIGQKKSVIISWYTGRQLEFYADEFEETEHGYD